MPGLSKIKYLFLTFAIGYSTIIQAQFMEFGGGPGFMNYSGDLVRGFDLNTTTFAGTVFYRMNLSEIVTLRLAIAIGSVKGAETPIDPFAQQRDHSFSNSALEFSSVFEYHFLDFKSKNALHRWSPYIYGGFGMVNISKIPQNSGAGKLQAVLPLGTGLKILIAKKYTIGLETGARKTFFDYLDGISDGDQTIKDYQYGNPNDDDWYFFTNLSFSIILFNIPCPFPYIPNQSLLSD